MLHLGSNGQLACPRGGIAVSPAHIVEIGDRDYLMMDESRSHGATAPMTEATTAVTRSWRPLAMTAVAVGALLAATLALWGYYGTAVFYEMILAGIAMCF